jgi:hypothetical protein
MDRSTSSKYSTFHRGVLESGSLAEVAHFIKKAKQQLDYARYAIENSDFSFAEEVLSPVDNKIAEISRMIVETRLAVEVAAANMTRKADALEEKREKEKDTSNGFH